jgi:nanoRNase/pAp phosphatase (c-di-AMP/oligoRNAs hydrolase)
VAIDQVASRLGGGGHVHAAGVMLHATIAQARERVVPDLLRIVTAPAAATPAPAREPA